MIFNRDMILRLAQEAGIPLPYEDEILKFAGALGKHILEMQIAERERGLSKRPERLIVNPATMECSEWVTNRNKKKGPIGKRPVWEES